MWYGTVRGAIGAAAFLLFYLAGAWVLAAESRCCPGDHAVATAIEAAPAGFWTARGRLGEAIVFASGERLELWWTGFFPRYELKYFRSPAARGETIGRCHFSQGCNRAFYLAPASAQGAAAACLAGVTWESYDYGHDGGEPGYLDRYIHSFDGCAKRYEVRHELLFYACAPPISHYPDVCASACEPPFLEEFVDGRPHPRIFKSSTVVERSMDDEAAPFMPVHVSPSLGENGG